MKSIAASIGYVKGRDRIDLRWAPRPNEHGSGNLFGWFGGGDSKNLEIRTVTPSIDLSRLQRPEGGNNVWYLGGGLLVLLVLIILLVRDRKKKKAIVAEGGFDNKKSVFDEDEPDDFSDLAAPPVEKIKEMAEQAPEKVAAVLEKWFQEDENK